MKRLLLSLLLVFSVGVSAETVEWLGGAYIGPLFKPTASLGDGTSRQISIPHGQGTLTWPNGRKYVGELKYGIIHGQGTVTLPDGMKYVGDFRDGIQHSHGSLTPPDSCNNNWRCSTYVGQFKNGKPNGLGTMILRDGTKYVGEFRDTRWHGQGTLTAPNGRKYVGEFRNYQFNGQGKETWPTGQIYVGEYKDGVPNGYGTMSFPDGSNYVGELKNGSYWRGTESDKNGNAIATYSVGKRQSKSVTRHG